MMSHPYCQDPACRDPGSVADPAAKTAALLREWRAMTPQMWDAPSPRQPEYNLSAPPVASSAPKSTSGSFPAHPVVKPVPVAHCIQHMSALSCLVVIADHSRSKSGCHTMPEASPVGKQHGMRMSANQNQASMCTD